MTVISESLLWDVGRCYCAAMVRVVLSHHSKAKEQKSDSVFQIKRARLFSRHTATDSLNS